LDSVGREANRIYSIGGVSFFGF